MAAPQRTLLIGLDGVLARPAKPGKHFGQVAAHLLAQRFGKTPQEWLAAHYHAIHALVPGMGERPVAISRSASAAFRDANYRWVQSLFTTVGLNPPDGLEAQELADVLHYRAAKVLLDPISSAVKAVADLQETGRSLILTSGHGTAHARGTLKALGVLRSFKTIYGFELLDQFKDGPGYFEALLDAEDTVASDCIAIDSQPEALQWAAALGICTVLVREQTTAASDDSQADLVIKNLAQLPAALVGEPLPNASSSRLQTTMIAENI